MTPPAAVRDALQPPPEALEICAADLAVDRTQVRVLPRATSGVYFKSDVFYIGSAASEVPLFVVKQDAGAYDPRHEMEALEYAADLLGQNAARSADSPETRLGVVQPVGWGADPRFLVTRYQPGEAVQTAFNGVVLHWRGPRPFEKAHANARLMGRWLGEFRARGARDSGGLEPAAYLDDILERAGALKCTIGAGRPMDALLRKVERYLHQLEAEDLERMLGCYPKRGDATPANFLLGDDGVLYAFDMEGFGFEAMEHDISCLHHALEYDGVRSPAGARRASALWRSFWEEYEHHGSSPTFALLSYIRYVLGRMQESAQPPATVRLRRRVRNRIWIHNRLAWLDALTGDLSTDAVQMKCNL